MLPAGQVESRVDKLKVVIRSLGAPAGEDREVVESIGMKKADNVP